MAASIVSPCLRYFSYSTFLYYPKYPLHSLFPFFSFFPKENFIFIFISWHKQALACCETSCLLNQSCGQEGKRNFILYRKYRVHISSGFQKKKVTIKKIITITVDLLNISVEQSNTGAFSFFPIKYSLRTKMQVKTMNDPLT